MTLLSCGNQSDTTGNSTKEQDKSQNTFATCFAGIDTLKAGQSIGCAGGTYKLINDKYVIHMLPDFPIQFDSCYSVTIDSSNAGRLTELLVFDKKDASLTNICTDLIINNAPKPTQQLQAQSGQLIIGFSDPTELYGNKTHHTTVLIKRLVFIDSKTGEKIELENELLWKVLDTGTPG
ncbi:MAG: hypothetical protein R3A43_03360 [Bacteroidia bacterium]